VPTYLSYSGFPRQAVGTLIKQMPATHRRRRIGLFAVALACRLAALAPALADSSRLLVPPDSTEYVSIARNLNAGHGFSSDTSPAYHQDLRRTPVYPFLLAAVFRLPHAGIRTAAVVGAVLGSLAAVVTYGLALQLFGSHAALAAGLLLAVDASSVSYDVVLLTEGLFTLLIVSSALWLSKRPFVGRNLAGAALLLGAAILCRPIALLLPIAVLPIVIWRSTGVKRVLRDYVLVNAIGGLAAALWVARNALVAGVVTYSSIGAVNLYFHRAAAIQARIEGRDVEVVRDAWQRQFDVTSGSASEQAKLAQLEEQGWDLITRHPGIYVRAYAAALVRMAGPDGEVLGQLVSAGRETPAVGWLIGASALQLLVTYAAAAVGLCDAAVRAARRSAMVVPLTFLAYFIVAAGPEVYPRFRVPMMPFIVILSGAGFQTLRVHRSGGRASSLAGVE